MHATPSPSARSEVIENVPRRVVVGSDGSHWGQNALVWAAEHAWRTDAELDVWLWSRTGEIPDNGGMNHVTSTFPLLSVSVHGAGTDPVHDLEAAARGAGLLVIGYRGHSVSPSGLDGAVLPLISEVACDTVVVRGRPTSVHGANLRVTALISGGEDDDHVLSRAAAIALEHRSGLRVVHALPAPATRDALAADHQFVLDQAARRLEKLDRRPSHTVVLLHGGPHEAVSRCTDSDLVVVGAGDHLARTGRCGSVTRAALHQSPCPVLVVHGPSSSPPQPEAHPHVPSTRAATGRHDISAAADRPVRASV
jgi:nucleotide-binding universal stress UspA family protein